MPPFHSVSCTRVSVDTPCFVSVVLSKCVIRAQLARRGLLAGGGFLMCGLWLLPVYTHRFFLFFWHGTVVFLLLVSSRKARALLSAV